MLGNNNTTTVTMAIREELMEYFKGSCVSKMISISSVKIRSRPTSNEFQYERREASVRKPSWLILSNIPLLEIELEPAMAVFYTEAFGRSPQLKTVETELREFFNQYLPGVELGDKDGRITY